MALIEKLQEADPALIVEAIIEGLNTNLEGWAEERDRATILQFIEDLLVYVNCCRE